jgi:glycerophosphoryl diester phosphodiesterase
MIFDGRPSVVGHRGFGGGRPDGYRENTMPSDAVRLADAGADALCVDDVPGVLSALAAR